MRGLCEATWFSMASSVGGGGRVAGSCSDVSKAASCSLSLAVAFDCSVAPLLCASCKACHVVRGFLRLLHM